MKLTNNHMANKIGFFVCIVTPLLGLISCGSGGSSGSTSTVIPDETTALTTGELPTKNNDTFSYASGGQMFIVENVPAGSSVGVAVFRNDASTNENDDLKIGNKEFAKKGNSKNSFKKSKKLRGQKVKDRNFRFNYPFSNSGLNNTNKKDKRSDDPIGTRDSFYHSETKDPITNLRVEAFQTFELMYSSSKCLIYSEVNDDTDEPYIPVSRAKFIGDAFTKSNPFHTTGDSIFEVVAKNFGHPWGIDADGLITENGGIDGEEQVIILLYNGNFDMSTLGYFYPVDEAPKGTVNESDGYISNGAEIVYLNRFIVDDDIDVLGTLAHEFQHLCDFNQKRNEDNLINSSEDEFNDNDINKRISTLFNEGKSVLSEDLNGFSLEINSGNQTSGNDFIFNAINSYFNLLSIKKASFLPNFFAFEGGGDDYGKGYLFWRFIYDTYGADAVTAASKSKYLAPRSIEEATGKSIDVLIQQFQLALMQLNSDTPSDASINISSLDINQSYFSTKGVPIGKLDSVTFQSGFQNSVIKNDGAYLFKFYKIEPVNGKVSFTVDNLKSDSSFSIFTTIINK